VERLLGKDIAQRQQQRADRVAQLEKELAELNAKK
jgi:cell division protein FtsB